MSSLFLPSSVATARQREQVNASIDEMVKLVESAFPNLVQIADSDGARLQTCAALLKRCLELLSSARAADRQSGAAPVVELATRSIFEASCRGRYLLKSPSASDEFARMCTEYERHERNLGAKIGAEVPTLPHYIAILGANMPPRSRALDLWRVCEALDDIEDRAADDQMSARSSYALHYQWLSNSAAHAGLSSVKRFVQERQGVLFLNNSVQPLTSAWPLALVSAHVGELAVAVFEAFELSSDALKATAVVLPRKA